MCREGEQSIGHPTHGTAHPFDAHLELVGGCVHPAEIATPEDGGVYAAAVRDYSCGLKGINGCDLSVADHPE